MPFFLALSAYIIIMPSVLLTGHVFRLSSEDLAPCSLCTQNIITLNLTLIGNVVTLVTVQILRSKGTVQYFVHHIMKQLNTGQQYMSRPRGQAMSLFM